MSSRVVFTLVAVLCLLPGVPAGQTDASGVALVLANNGQSNLTLACNNGNVCLQQNVSVTGTAVVKATCACPTGNLNVTAAWNSGNSPSPLNGLPVSFIYVLENNHTIGLTDITGTARVGRLAYGPHLLTFNACTGNESSPCSTGYTADYWVNITSPTQSIRITVSNGSSLNLIVSQGYSQTSLRWVKTAFDQPSSCLPTSPPTGPNPNPTPCPIGGAGPSFCFSTNSTTGAETGLVPCAQLAIVGGATIVCVAGGCEAAAAALGGVTIVAVVRSTVAQYLPYVLTPLSGLSLSDAISEFKNCLDYRNVTGWNAISACRIEAFGFGISALPVFDEAPNLIGSGSRALLQAAGVDHEIQLVGVSTEKPVQLMQFEDGSIKATYRTTVAGNKAVGEADQTLTENVFIDSNGKMTHSISENAAGLTGIEASSYQAGGLANFNENDGTLVINGKTITQAEETANGRKPDNIRGTVLELATRGQMQKFSQLNPVLDAYEYKLPTLNPGETYAIKTKTYGFKQDGNRIKIFLLSTGKEVTDVDGLWVVKGQPVALQVKSKLDGITDQVNKAFPAIKELMEQEMKESLAQEPGTLIVVPSDLRYDAQTKAAAEGWASMSLPNSNQDFENIGEILSRIYSR